MEHGGNEMDKKTAKALEKSIKHWEQNVRAEEPFQASTSAFDCALCMEFPDCFGCPVMKHTGDDNCYGTPYYEAADALTGWKSEPEDETKEIFRKAAQAELDFLISLRVETKEDA